MQGQKNILLAAQVDYKKYCSDALELLQQKGFKVILNESGLPLHRECLETIADRLDGVVAGTEKWDSRMIALARRLKVIARFGVGVDNIDLKAAKEHGIVVTNTKGLNTDAVSDMTVCFMICLLKKAVAADRLMHKGIWERQIGMNLCGKTVGIIGFGDIGRRVCKKLSGFDCKMIAYDKYPDEKIAGILNVTLTGFEEVLKNSDIISLHLPYLPETNHIIGAKEISLMKDGAYLVNTARGSLVDEKALYDALKAGKLAGAALDVFEEEPCGADHPLLGLDNVICTPHMAGASAETFSYGGMVTARAIIDVFEGRTPKNALT